MTIYKYFSQHSGFFILPFVIVPLGIHFLIKQILLLKPKIKHFIDTDLEYYNKKKDRFIYIFKDSFVKYNLNIDPIFYIKVELDELMKNNSNYLERHWKSKVLIETTPRGNIIMFYNPYKLGFYYYSDSTGIPYPILNAVAMKYVTVFYCRDFFVDEHFVQNSKKNGLLIFDSPLLPILFTEPKSLIINKKQSTNIDGPFAKLKNYKTNPIVANLVAIKIAQKSTIYFFYNKFITIIKDFTMSFSFDPLWGSSENRRFAPPGGSAKRPIRDSVKSGFLLVADEPKKIPIIVSKIGEPEKEYNFNRFMRVGYVKDFKPLNVVKDFSKVNGFQSNLLENLSTETNLQKQVMSYKDYKIMEGFRSR